MQMQTANVIERPALSADKIDLIRRTLCAGATNDELALYIATANRLGLDPLTRQIHAVKRWDSRLGREVMTIQVGIDGLRLAAHRTGEMDGYDPPQWCGLDGVWRDAWLDRDPPAAARVTVYRRGHAHPYTAVATLHEYCQHTKDGRPMGLWARMPSLMLNKVAEALALRRAFPVELAGVYEPAELDQTTPASASIAATARAELPDQMTDRQRRQMMALCGELAMDRDERIALARLVIGRDIQSASELTQGEAELVIAALKEWREFPPTAERLAADLHDRGMNEETLLAEEEIAQLDELSRVRIWQIRKNLRDMEK